MARHSFRDHSGHRRRFHCRNTRAVQLPCLCRDAASVAMLPLSRCCQRGQWVVRQGGKSPPHALRALLFLHLLLSPQLLLLVPLALFLLLLQVRPDGLLDMASLEAAIRPDTALVSHSRGCGRGGRWPGSA
jgi:hypothetical protein